MRWVPLLTVMSTFKAHAEAEDKINAPATIKLRHSADGFATLNILG
jgi:hypothetical protein